MDRGLNSGLGLGILRIVVGVIFIAHGWGKVFGGIGDTAGFFGSIGIPVPTLAAWAIGLLETGGGAVLLLGLFVTPLAVLLMLHMLTGIFLVHIPNGFFVIGPGAGGYEFNLLLVAALFTLIMAGAGNWALQDRLKKDVLEA
jgi:putative oxidoreductase